MVVLVTNGDITILQQTPLGLCQMDAIQYSWRVQIVQKKIKMWTVVLPLWLLRCVQGGVIRRWFMTPSLLSFLILYKEI